MRRKANSAVRTNQHRRRSSAARKDGADEGRRSADSGRRSPEPGAGGPPIERWLAVAATLPPTVPRAPISVLAGEALELSCWLAERWEAVGGAAPLPGMVAAVATGAIPGTAVEDLRELALAVAQAQARVQAWPEPVLVAPVDRGKRLLAELRQSLEFLFLGGLDGDRAAELARLTESHTDTSSHDALALSLEGFAQYAEQHRARLARLPGFAPAVINEARAVAGRLREQSALRLASAATARRQGAVADRNRLVALLGERVLAARRAARFVFREHPSLVKTVGSTYDRKRQEQSRARRASRRGAPPEPPPGAPA